MIDEILGNRWFGPPWLSSVCYDESDELRLDRRIDPPVDENCLDCGEPIEPGQGGTTMGYISREGATIRYVHKECRLRSVLGSPEHLDGKCFCNTGISAESTMTYRQEALAVWARLVGKQVQP